MNNFQETMAICKTIGYLELFVTFACNPKWPKITRFVESNGLRPDDRPDVLSRVFKMNLDRLIKDLMTENAFGKAIGGKVFIIFNFNSINRICYFIPTYTD